jgi:hypothetical protein
MNVPKLGRRTHRGGEVLVLARDFERAVAEISDRADTYGGTMLGGRETANARWRDLQQVRAIVRDLAIDRPLVRDIARAHDLARRFAETGPAAVVARDLMRALERSVTDDPERAGEGERGEARRVASSAAGLLTVATRLLPVADRPRHGEEYRSELWDLAQAGAGRLGQLGYALRQVRSAPRTGLALRSPRRRGAAS